MNRYEDFNQYSSEFDPSSEKLSSLHSPLMSTLHEAKSQSDGLSVSKLSLHGVHCSPTQFSRETWSQDVGDAYVDTAPVIRIFPSVGPRK